MSIIKLVVAVWDSSLRSEWQVLYGIAGGEMDGGAVHFPSPQLQTKLSFRWRNDWGISSTKFLFICVTNPESNDLNLIVIFSLCLKNLSESLEWQRVRVLGEFCGDILAAKPPKYPHQLPTALNTGHSEQSEESDLFIMDTKYKWY